MADPFSIPVRIVSNPPGMSELGKVLLSAGVGASFGLVAGLFAEPFKRCFEDWRRASKAATLLYRSTCREFALLTSLYAYLDKVLKGLPKLPTDEHGNSGGLEAQAILNDDQHRIVGIEQMCSEFNTDIYDHYYGGDKEVYYAIPGASAITVFFEYIARLRLSEKPSRQTAQIMYYEMNRAIYGLLAAIESQAKGKGKKFYRFLEAIREENIPPSNM